MNAPVSLSRRALLQAAGALIVAAPALAAEPGSAPVRPGPTDLDSWIAIGRDGRATVFVGKYDVGQGVDTAWAQIVGEELDLPASKVDVVMGDTGQCHDQGGVSASSGIAEGGTALRGPAAEARRLLLERASAKLGAPVDQLEAWDGVVSVKGAPKRGVTYAQLIADGPFNTELAWNGKYGSALRAPGKAKPKAVADYRVIGKSTPRRDVAGKVFGTAEYVTDIRVPGMVHARMVLPPTAGSVPVSVNEASLKDIPGARVVRQGDFLAVVAPREWDAVRASQTLEVEWSKVAPPFPGHEALYDHLRNAPVAKEETSPVVGDIAAAFAGAAKIVEAEYEWPYQSHASMGPACAVADVRADRVTVWTATQKAHAMSLGCARLLGRPPGSVRVITLPGPGSYGRNDAGDAGLAAALLSSKVGKPVRLQGMRHEATGWDPKGPASVHKVRAALGADGSIQGYEFTTKGFSRFEVAFLEADPKDTLVGQLTGFKSDLRQGFGTPEERYEFANRRMAWATAPAFLPAANPLRGAHLRDPLGLQMHFASEGMIDEAALATGQDPIALRLRHLKAPRDVALLKAVAEKSGWKVGPPGARRQTRGEVMIGQGVAYGHSHGSIVAMVAEVEVTPSTGRVWARRFWVAHDCGLIVNPKTLHVVIEGNVVQGLSRTLFEEVTFDTAAVTSVDWATYPILDIGDAPETIETILIDRPDVEPSGAGEASTRFVAAAVGNAVFDATGVRFRRAPLTPERIKAGLDAART